MEFSKGHLQLCARRASSRPTGGWVRFIITFAALSTVLIAASFGPVMGPVPNSAHPPQFTALMGSNNSTNASFQFLPSSTTMSSFGTWPMYDQNGFRTGAQELERTLAFGNISLLTVAPHFPFSARGPIAGSTPVANDTAYFGTMAGTLYALNLTTGTVYAPNGSTNRESWQVNTTNQSVPGCPRQPTGIISTPAVWNNLVFVGTGANVTQRSYGWVRAYLASGPRGGQLAWYQNLTASSYVSSSWQGAYIWSSPVVWSGSVYVGFASGCDNPLVQGALFQLNATTGAVEHVAHMVPTSEVGASIWSSPSIDPKNDSIWVTTGNNDPGVSESLF
jgi:hypothetical protein